MSDIQFESGFFAQSGAQHLTRHGDSPHAPAAFGGFLYQHINIRPYGGNAFGLHNGVGDFGDHGLLFGVIKRTSGDFYSDDGHDVLLANEFVGYYVNRHSMAFTIVATNAAGEHFFEADMARTTNARQKALEATILLLRSQGYQATGLAQILAESGAPKGSFYFHFPGGKEQLALEALALYGQSVEQSIDRFAAQFPGNAGGFVRALCAAIPDEMVRSDWRFGCAAQNIANELTPADEALHEAVRKVFAVWVAALARALAMDGQPDSRALETARALLASIEGARTIAKVERSGRAFEAIAAVFAPVDKQEH